MRKQSVFNPNVVLASMLEPMPPSRTISARLPPPMYSNALKPNSCQDSFHVGLTLNCHRGGYHKRRNAPVT